MNDSSTRIANTWLTKRVTHSPKVVDGLKMFEARFRGPKISELSWFPEPVPSSAPCTIRPLPEIRPNADYRSFDSWPPNPVFDKNEWKAASWFSRSHSPSSSSWQIASNAPIREKKSDYTASRSPGSTSTDGFNNTLNCICPAMFD